jgi:lysozyme
MTISYDEAQSLLHREINRVSEAVTDLVKVPLASHEHAALISFAYNVGLGNLENSTLLRLLNEGHKAEAAEELLKWVYCKREKLPGLVRRREAEYKLFIGQ